MATAVAGVVLLLGWLALVIATGALVGTILLVVCFATGWYGMALINRWHHV